MLSNDLKEEVDEWINYLKCEEPFSLNYTEKVLNSSISEQEWGLLCTQFQELPKPKVFQLIFYCTTFAVGLFGNAIIMFHIFCHGKIVRDLHSSFVLSLSISDMIYICLVPMQAIQMVTKSWIFGETFCRLFNMLDIATNHASVVAITLMCYDRMLAVTKPHSFSHRSKYKTRVLLALAWISGFVLATPNLIFSHLVNSSYLENRISCSAVIYDVNWTTVFLTVLYLVDCACPLVITTIMYILTLKAIRDRNQQFNSNAANNPAHRRRSLNTRMVVLVLAIISTFWICYFPFWTLTLVFEYIPITRTSFLTYLGQPSIALTYVNAALNPFFYSVLPETRRKILIKTLLCRDDSLEDRSFPVNDQVGDNVALHRNKSSPNASGDEQPRQSEATTANTDVITAQKPESTNDVPAIPEICETTA